MNGKRKDYVVTALCVFGIIVSMAVGWFSGYAYRDYKAAAERNAILGTIQQLENSVQRLGTQLDTAESQLRAGQRANSDAGETTKDLADSLGQSRQLLDDSEKRVADIKRQFASIDKANNITATGE